MSKQDISRRDFIRQSAAAVPAIGIASTLGAAQTVFPSQPNIVLILTDQERQTRYFPEGWIERNLPNFNRLQNNGLSFSHAFCNSAMCSPSRATLFTGLYPAQHQVTDTLPEAAGQNKSDEVHDLNPETPNLAHVLKSAGYQVVYKGKWHLSRPAGTAWSTEDVGKYGFDGWDPPDGGEDTDPENFGGGRSNHDQRYADDAVAFLQTVDSSKPFALIVSLINPHDVAGYPSTYTEDYSATYLQGDIELPPNIGEDLQNNYKPHTHAELLNRLALAMGALATDKRRKEYLNFYGNLLKKVDQQIGSILDVLDAPRGANPPLSESTLVIRTADHGEMGLAHGGLRQKMFVCYEEAMHLPLVISNPVLFPNAQNCDALVSLVDLVPTLANLAQTPNRAQWDFRGVDFSSLLSNPSGEVQDAILFTFDDIKAGQENIEQMVSPPNRIRCIREKNWKYARYFDGHGKEQQEYEMYDLVNDPQEMNNLAHPNHPRYHEPAVVQQRNRLATKLAALEAGKLAPLPTTVARAAVHPEGFRLEQNYPNPFNPTTQIRYHLPQAQHVRLEIVSENGRRVRMLLDEVASAGMHQIEWNGCDDSGQKAAAGVYLYSLKCGDNNETRKMVLAR